MINSPINFKNTMETQNISPKPLVIVNMNRFITQTEYCKRTVGMNLQNLQNMIKRHQIPHYYVKELGITLVDTLPDDKTTVEMTLPKGEFTESQLGEHFAKFAMETLLKNRELEFLLQEKENLVSKQVCELSKQNLLIAENSIAIDELAYINNDFREKLKNLMSELQIKDCELAKQVCEVTTQSKIIAELQEKIMFLETENAKTTDILDIKQNMSKLIEKLSAFPTDLQFPKEDILESEQAPQEQEEQWFVQYGVFLQPNNNLQKAIQGYFHEMNKNNTLISDTEHFIENTKAYINLLKVENTRCTPEKVSVSTYNDITNSFSLLVGEKVTIRFIKVKS
jgi:hypothetical protein